LAPKAVAKAEAGSAGELVVPVSAKAADVPTALVDLLQELLPAPAPEEPALASAAP
jgi:hypothetical protein